MSFDNTEPNVGIVLVNYNGEKFQNDCIKTVKEMDYSNYKIILVDNDSKDNSIQMVRDNYPDVIIIENGNNYGVAKGNNIGIRAALDAGCEYILLLNNDTELDKKLLSKLVSKADVNTITVPKIYYYKPKDLIWFAGGKISWLKGTTEHIGVMQKDSEILNRECKVSYAPTCCFLVHKAIFEKIGLMDENYFMYYDDTDFCVRATDNNINILYVPEANIFHKVSSSTGGENSLVSEYYMYRNRLYFIDKFNKYKLFAKIITKLAIIKRLIKWKIHNKKDFYNIVKEAYKDYSQKKFSKKEF